MCGPLPRALLTVLAQGGHAARQPLVVSAPCPDGASGAWDLRRSGFPTWASQSQPSIVMADAR